jgi:hypothetical protein
VGGLGRGCGAGGGPGRAGCAGAVAAAAAGGAALGLEARVWAAVALLARPGARETAPRLTERVRGELAGLTGRDAAISRWRLLLAFHAGRARHPGLAQQILAPVISRGATAQQQAAHAILRAIVERQADTRLQIIFLEAGLAATPPEAADDLLRLHAALAASYDSFRPALPHAMEDVALRQRRQGPGHPQTLTTRALTANLTGQCGDPGGALRLLTALLPDRERVLDRGHAGVLEHFQDPAACPAD